MDPDTLELQADSKALADEHTLFDGFQDKYGELKGLLDRTAPIVENPNLRHAMVIVQDSDYKLLNTTEQKALRHLRY